MFDVDFSSSGLLSTFPFLRHLLMINNERGFEEQCSHTHTHTHPTDGFYASDERLSSSSAFIELLNTSNRTNWHLKRKTSVKKYRPPYDDLSHDDYVKQERKERRRKKKSSTMIIASHLIV